MIKIVVVHLWFNVAHLTDSFLEAVKVATGAEYYFTEQLQVDRMSIYNNQSGDRAACKPVDGKFLWVKGMT